MDLGKNLLQRVLNVGDIRISVKLIDSPEMIMGGIGTPYYYASLLRLKTVEAEAVAGADPGEEIF